MSHAYLAFLAAIAVRTVVVLAFLVLGLRLLGKREAGQMNVYDLALIMALANAVQNAMTNGAGDLSVGLVSAGALLLAGRALAALFVRRPDLERAVVGSPTPLITNGRMSVVNMRREGVTRDTLMTVLREHGVADPADVKLAILEVDGSISVVPKQPKPAGP